MGILYVKTGSVWKINHKVNFCRVKNYEIRQVNLWWKKLGQEQNNTIFYHCLELHEPGSKTILALSGGSSKSNVSFTLLFNKKGFEFKFWPNQNNKCWKGFPSGLKFSETKLPFSANRRLLCWLMQKSKPKLFRSGLCLMLTISLQPRQDICATFCLVHFRIKFLYSKVLSIFKQLFKDFQKDMSYKFKYPYYFPF